MKNILITVMLIVVVVLLFNSIIADDTNGTKALIEQQGNSANTKIRLINPQGCCHEEATCSVNAYATSHFYLY